ncbi:DUF3168 domain-containing protein [Pseudomonas sp. G.S.17]|uniref:DUF3168 domain-containing protein n=1 Tax=Pseudomonas sp. G.S.17 TaxID=3137451 RepID=UPI00311CA442
MYPPLFAVCSADQAVTALLGTGTTRIYLFGLAPDKVVKPYVVWQSIGGSPENVLSGRPDMDGHALQVDVYALTAQSAREVATAIQRAIELECTITGYNGESRDPVTMSYRSSFDIDWIVSR